MELYFNPNGWRTGLSPVDHLLITVILLCLISFFWMKHYYKLFSCTLKKTIIISGRRISSSSIHLQINVYVWIWIRKHIYTYVTLNVCIYGCMRMCLCMQIRLFLYVYLCVNACICVFRHEWQMLRQGICMHLHVCLYAWLNASMYVGLLVPADVCVGHAWIYTDTHKYIYLHLCIHIYNYW